MVNSDNRSILELLRSDEYIRVNKSLAHGIGIEEAIIFSELISTQSYLNCLCIIFKRATIKLKHCKTNNIQKEKLILMEYTNKNEKSGCDYSIAHFMNGDIRENCFYKACY